MTKLSMTINGSLRTLDVEDRTLLVTALRDHLGLTGTHIGCDTAQCGACSVRLDGRIVKSCSILAAQAEGGDIQTIEGVAPDGKPLHPMQKAFSQCLGLQCGYCTPGMVMLALDLVAENPAPDADTIAESLSGNLCRCTGYSSIVAAIQLGAKEMRERAKER
jgi:aerobic carbon-monoxide dehydrogenase small subunit